MKTTKDTKNTGNSPIIGFRYPRKEEAEQKCDKEKKKISQVAVELFDKWLAK